MPKRTPRLEVGRGDKGEKQFRTRDNFDEVQCSSSQSREMLGTSLRDRVVEGAGGLVFLALFQELTR